MMNEAKQPYFSIIIPSYMRANIIHKTLDTIWAQTFTDYEVLVVDNCSTDNTKEVLQPLIDAGKLQFIQHDKNYERSKSRNTGLNHAKGRFVTFLDSDDLMYPNNLQDAFDFSQANPDTRIFHNLFEMVKEDGSKEKRYQYKPMADPLKHIATGNFLACIGVFIHREIAEKFRFDERKEIVGSEDWDFWLRIMGHYPNIGRINKINSAIVEHGGRTVNTIDIQALINRRAAILAKIDADEYLTKAYAPYRKYMRASSDLYLAANANSSGDPKLALQYIKKAVKGHPNFLADPRLFIALKNYVKQKVSG